MLTYSQLRKLLENFPKYQGSKKFPNFSVVNEGFPGKFNLSFVEAEWMKLFHNFIRISRSLIYTKIQPVIRDNDFVKIIIPKKRDSYKYLGLFDMADISGCVTLTNQKKWQEIARFTIDSMWIFLIDTLKLDSDKLFIKIFNGGKISEVTKGRYNIDRYIEADKFGMNEWKKMGINESNFILDNTRDTLLTLYLNQPTPWGYRTEILYDIGKDELLDIGTVEYVIWEPIIKDGKIIGIKPWNCCFVINLVGVERILMVKNKLDHIVKCDHIYPLYKKIENLCDDKTDAFLMTESLRVIHRVIADSNGYKNLSRNKKRIFRYYLNTIKNFKTNEDILKKLLSKNAELQPCYPELKKSVGLTTKEILDYKKANF